METEIGRGMKIIGEVSSPVCSPVYQVIQNNQVIDMAGAVLGREMGEAPHQGDVEDYKDRVDTVSPVP